MEPLDWSKSADARYGNSLLVCAGLALGIGLAFARHGGGWGYLKAAAVFASAVLMLIGAVRLFRKSRRHD
jgi:hypothetical protein